SVSHIVDLDLFKLAIGLQKANQIQDQGPTSGIKANRGTLNKKNHKITHKHSPTILYKMSQPANDEFSQHLNDDEESNHEDASDTGCRIPISAEIHAVEKERKARSILLMLFPKEPSVKISWNG
ncbi:hypothetical protein Tco_1023204, partial [Tanacetum coccineum]